jgi:hypothetical protein
MMEGRDEEGGVERGLLELFGDGRILILVISDLWLWGEKLRRGGEGDVP